MGRGRGRRVLGVVATLGLLATGACSLEPVSRGITFIAPQGTEVRLDGDPLEPKRIQLVDDRRRGLASEHLRAYSTIASFGAHEVAMRHPDAGEGRQRVEVFDGPGRLHFWLEPDARGRWHVERYVDSHPF